jgi:hypothetical protein
LVNNDHLGDLGISDKIKQGRIINIYKKNVDNYERNTIEGHMIHSTILVIKESTPIKISAHDSQPSTNNSGQKLAYFEKIFVSNL